MATFVVAALTAGAALSGCGTTKTAPEGTRPPATADRAAAQETSAALVAEGQRVFRFDTFGDEQLWADTLRLHEVVEKNVDPTTHSPDRVSPKLPALRAYQHSLPAPPPPAGSFDAAGAERGRALFDRTCAKCHVGGSGTDNDNGTLHAPAETGVDGAYAARTANKAYRTTPLRALWQHPPYFHDGGAATLVDVAAHYNRVRALGLTAEQERDLVEYLKSL